MCLINIKASNVWQHINFLFLSALNTGRDTRAFLYSVRCNTADGASYLCKSAFLLIVSASIKTFYSHRPFHGSFYVAILSHKGSTDRVWESTCVISSKEQYWETMVLPSGQHRGELLLSVMHMDKVCWLMSQKWLKVVLWERHVCSFVDFYLNLAFVI